MLQQFEVRQAVLALIGPVPCKEMEKRGPAELFISGVVHRNLVAKGKFLQNSFALFL
jgi:hypothetical protein